MVLLSDVAALAEDVAAPESVRLVRPGRGRRAPLRYALANGGTAHVELEQTLTTKITTDGFERTEATPKVRYAFTLGPFEAARESFVVPLRIDAIDVVDGEGDAELAASVRALFAPFVGLRAELLLSSTGRTLRRELDRPSAVAPADWQRFLETFEQLPSPIALPEEPIAPGGQWEVRTTTRVQRLPVETTTVYELLGRRGERVDVRIVGTQSALARELTRGLPSGARATVAAHRGALEGEGSLDLGSPAFLGRLRLDAAMTLEVSIPSAGSQTTVRTETGLLSEGRVVRAETAAAP